MITLVNSKCAKAGYEFINYGIAEECHECGLNKTCLGNLEIGRKYRIIALRDLEHNCKIHEKVKVVEVKEAEITGAINKKLAFPGSTIEFEPVECNVIFCKNFKNCCPESLKKGDKCKILESLESLECENKSNLVIVKLQRA